MDARWTRLPRASALAAHEVDGQPRNGSPSLPIVTDFAAHLADDGRIQPGENTQQRQMSSLSLQASA